LLASVVVISLAAITIRAGDATRSIRLIAFTTLLLTVASGMLLPWDPDLLSSGPFLYGALYGAAADEPTPDLRATLRERGDLLFSVEGPDALVTVRRAAGGFLSMQVNGKTDASTGGDMRTQTLTAQLPLLVRASRPTGGNGPLPAARVLIVGLGSGVTAAAALSHP